MLNYIKGKIVNLTVGRLILENNGIGYDISISTNTYSKIGDKKEIKIYVDMIVRDDIIKLYGFYDEAELEMFNLLQTVTKIGPKVAIGILSILSPKGIKKAIIFEDHKTLVQAPGIGKKTSERIVLELRDKVNAEDIRGEDIEAIDISKQEDMGLETEAMEALLTLGYTRIEILETLSKIDMEEKSTEDVIKLFLRDIGR